MYTPTTVRDLLDRLGKMQGHLGRRDKKTVADARDAILELADRLHTSQVRDVMQTAATKTGGAMQAHLEQKQADRLTIISAGEDEHGEEAVR